MKLRSEDRRSIARCYRLARRRPNKVWPSHSRRHLAPNLQRDRRRLPSAVSHIVEALAPRNR